MSNVREILDRVPPSILYHYTNQAGLLGILNTKEIWVTHTQYLNDVLEFRHAVDIVREELRVLMKEQIAGSRRELLEELQQSIDERSVESINVCVCSFSEAEDVLSQWRAYGDGAGFSIGFSGPFLRDAIRPEGFWLVPCVYDDAQQRELIRQLIEDVIAENMARTKQDEEAFFEPGGNVLGYLYRYAPILKHRSFSEEREWRIISRPLMCVHDRFAYRAGRSMLIPYFRIPLSSTEHPFSIEDVVVGPTPNRVQSYQSVKGLLVKHGLRKTTLRASESPYRSW